MGSALMVVVVAMGLCESYRGRGSARWRWRWRACGFDIEAVLDGDVEAEDGGSGDGEVGPWVGLCRSGVDCLDLMGSTRSAYSRSRRVALEDQTCASPFTSRFSGNVSFQPFVLRSQLYSGVKDRTQVDRELEVISDLFVKCIFIFVFSAS
nr:hypothetical protein CFP56_13725 [Quercus suber]